MRGWSARAKRMSPTSCEEVCVPGEMKKVAMRVYVFGAGATQGSQRPGTGPPKRVAPLMNRLFAPEYVDYAYEVTLTPGDLEVLRTSIGSTPVEEWLTAQWAAICLRWLASL
jgi:hypothetical protein